MMEDAGLLEKAGYPVTKEELYADVDNYERWEAFLKNCQNGVSGELVVYEKRKDGELTRREFTFDGEKMMVFSWIGGWDDEGNAIIASNTCHEIKQWEYTDKGWFIYEFVVPEFPEVSEVIPAHVMVKVKPWKEEYRKICEKYLLPIGYYQSNMFTIDWDENSKEKLMENRAPSTPFQTSIPEIVEMKQKDGICVLTIDAVCEMLGEEQAMRHQLTIQLNDDGNVTYLGNKVLIPYE